MFPNQESSSSSSDCDWLGVPATDPSQPEAQSQNLKKARCSCNCAQIEPRYSSAVIPQEGLKLKIITVPVDETPSLTKCACYYKVASSVLAKTAVPDLAGKVSVPKPSTLCSCFFDDERYTVTKTDLKGSQGPTLAYQRVPKPGFIPRRCCSCVCSFCCLCVYAGTQYWYPDYDTQKSKLAVNSTGKARSGTPDGGQSFSEQQTGSFHLQTNTLSQVGATATQTQSTKSPRWQELQSEPKDKWSLGGFKQQVSALPVKRRIDSQLDNFPPAEPPTKRPRISPNSDETSAFRASGVWQSFSRQTEIASQGGAALPPTEPLLPPIGSQSSSWQQTSSWSLKCVKACQPSTASKGSPVRQASSFPSQTKVEKILGSTGTTEPPPVNKPPAKLPFNPQEKWVKKLKTLVKERKKHR